MSQIKQICAVAVLTALLPFAAGATQDGIDSIDQQMRTVAEQAAANVSSSLSSVVLSDSVGRATALRGVQIDSGPTTATIVFSLNATPAYDAYFHQSGKQLVVDLYDTIALPELETVILASGEDFSELQTSVVAVEPQFVTRVAVPLSTKSHFVITDGPDHLKIIVTPAAESTDSAKLLSQSIARQWEHQARSPRLAKAFLVEVDKRLAPDLKEHYQHTEASIRMASELLRIVKKDHLSLQLAGVGTNSAHTSESGQTPSATDLALHESVIRKAQHTLRTLISDYEARGLRILEDLAQYQASITERHELQRTTLATILETKNGQMSELESLASREFTTAQRDQVYFESLVQARNENESLLLESIQSLSATVLKSQEAIGHSHRQAQAHKGNAAFHASTNERLDQFDAAIASRGQRPTGKAVSVARRLDAFSTAMAEVAERQTSLNTMPLTHAAAFTESAGASSVPSPPSARRASTSDYVERTMHEPGSRARILSSTSEEIAQAERDGLIIVAQGQNTITDTPAGQQISIPPALSRMPSSNLINEGLSAAQDPLRQPVNVNFKNMPLDNVVSLLANKGQISVISEVDLAGGVTAQLKDITLGRAIEVILRQENLGIVEEDGIYRITDYVKAVAARRDTRMISLKNANAMEVKMTLAEVVASSPDAALVSLSANATTNMLIVQGPRDTVRDLEDMVAKLDVADPVLPTRTVIIPLNYADPGSVVGLLTVGGMLSGTGKASPDPRTRQIILTDLPQNVDAMLELIPTLDLPVKQVSIQAMVVDAIMNDDAETGFDWFLNAVQKGSPPIVGGHLESFGAAFEEPLSTAGSLAFSVLSGDINLDGIIRAEVLSNNAELLAEPVLITTENNPAVINLTSEFPYQEQTQTDAGGQIAATQFKEIGTILNVTPKVTHDKHIGVKIDVKQSVVTGFTTTEVPIEAKRQIITNLRLNDGETIFIGGLRQHDDRLTVKKVPVLGDIPVLNMFFRTNSVKKENIELLVFLTCNVMPDDTPDLTPYQKMKYDKLGGTPELVDGTRAVLRPYIHP